MILSLLNEIAGIKNKIDKAFHLDQASKLSEFHPILLNIIFDKNVRFFVDVNKVKRGLSDLSSMVVKTDLELDKELLDLLTLLASEDLRGNAGVLKCINFADQLNPEEIKVFLNILENKIRLGIGATDINKYCQTFKIDQYEVMFAKKVEHISDIDWNKRYCIQPKIDGNRCIDEKFEYKNKFLTRTGKPLTSIDFIGNQINNAFGKYPNFVLDGEIESGSTLESTGAIRRKSEQVEDAIYTLFGIYDYDQWQTKQHTDTYEEVYNRTKHLLELHPMLNVRLIPSYNIEAKSEEEFFEIVMKYYQEFLDQGYEGAVLKTLDHVYQPSAGTRRSIDWIKLKPKESTEGIIVDILEGDGEHQGMLGKFLVKWLDVTFEVSPGKIKHKERKEIMNNPSKYIGKEVEFFYQTLSVYGVPRGAFAKRIREDK
jgi:hypothetical protein